MITKNIIVETLKQYNVSYHLDSDCNQKYRWVMMLPDDHAEMESDILYICLLCDAIKRNIEKPGYNYLCIQNRSTGDGSDVPEVSKVPEVPAGIIVVNDNRDFSWLVNLMQQRCLKINEWINKMQDALIGNCDYQLLIDLSEPILNNFVAILDSSHRLIAFSKNTGCHNQINASLLEKGYLSGDILKKLGEAKRYAVYARESGVIISPPIEFYAINEAVTKMCRYGGEWLLQVVMECSTTPLSPGMIDLFELFMERIDICFIRQQHTHPAQKYTSLLSEMLYGDLSDPFIIGERTKNTELPFYGIFNAYRIVFSDNAVVPIGRFVQELTDYLATSRIVLRDFEVSVLNIYNSSDVQKLSSSYLEKLAPLFEEYGAQCGVSEPFTSLPEFKIACVQATRAQALGVQLRKPENLWQLDAEVLNAVTIKSDNNIFHYNDIYIYYLLYLAKSDAFNVFGNTSSISAFKKLLKYDRDHNTHLVQVLYTHLICERRATLTGKYLHLHRNSVLYHISRIEELIGIDLNDYWT
ncbi:MAG: helix-turn-helix domain-containing protein, partial [Firmicutes bacterium]|nr:helix-turn-helix domain-containing protein [Bacillota bacterium]